MSVEGTTVPVSGASQGIGAATARVLARRGARVLLVARTEALLDVVATTIRDSGGDAFSFPVDVADPAAVSDSDHQPRAGGRGPGPRDRARRADGVRPVRLPGSRRPIAAPRIS